MTRSILLALAAGSLLHADEPALPPEAKPLLPATLDLSKPTADFGTLESVEVAGAPRNPVARGTSLAKQERIWEVSVSTRFDEPIAKDQVCTLVIRARSLESDGPEGAARIFATVRQRSNSENNAVWRPLDIPRQWTTHYFSFHAGTDIPVGDGFCQLHLAGRKQIVEIADVQLYRFPAGFDIFNAPRMRATYEGREADAPWRTAAAERIAKHRQAPLVVQVVDPAGQPVAGAKVSVRMTRHAFGFGSAIVSQRLAGLAKNADPADDAKYRAVVDELFSRVVPENDLKVPVWPIDDALRETGDYPRRTRTALAWSLQWCADRRIAVRGHYLAWCYLEPWSRALKDAGQPRQILANIEQHAQMVTQFGKDWLVEWDVLNHPVPFAPGDALVDFLGPDTYADIYKTARALTPLPLYVNEDAFSPERTDGFEREVRHMIARGAKPDGAGFQSHYREDSFPGIAEVWQTWNRLAPLVPHLAVTEYDFESLDDRLHADNLGDMLTLAFSHPQMTGFLMWGFWEKAHWRPAAALFKADWTERPAVKVWRDLVKGKWWTTADLTSDAEGKASAPAYFGWYDIAVEKDGKTSTLTVQHSTGAGGPIVKLP